MNTKQPQSPPVLFRGLDPAIYSPLQVSFQSDQRRWFLEFRSEPSPEVIFSGDKPTLEEMVRACSNGHMSCLMVEVLMVVAAEAHGRAAK